MVSVTDDLSRLRTECVVFDECDFRGVNLTESEHAGSAFRNCTFDRSSRPGLGAYVPPCAGVTPG
jgi:hypothetical protein